MPAITYTLLINNMPAGSQILESIQQIEVEEDARLAGMLRLKLAIAVAEDGSGWEFIDDDTFSRLTKLTLLVTVGTGLPQPLIEAYVVESKSQFSNTPGQSTLEVVAMDATILMNLEQKVRAWANMADSDIATLIFAQYGFIPMVDRTQPMRIELDETVIQHGTDIQFLRYLAQRNGYLCYIEANPFTLLPEAHFHPPKVDDNPQGTLTVNMGPATNVNRMNGRFNMIQPTTAATANIAIGSQAEESANVTSTALTELGRQTLLNGSQPRHTLLSHTGLAATAELQTLAQAVVDQSAWAIEIEGDLDTDAYGDLLRAKRPILVRGTGQNFSGAYFVEKVQHLITADNYTQHFTLKRNATGLTGREFFALNL